MLIVWAARQGPVQQIGAALFILPLLPTLNINAFVPEQLVHDRYLYLPLLGFLMIVVPSLVSLTQGILEARPVVGQAGRLRRRGDLLPAAGRADGALQHRVAG